MARAPRSCTRGFTNAMQENDTFSAEIITSDYISEINLYHYSLKPPVYLQWMYVSI